MLPQPSASPLVPAPLPLVAPTRLQLSIERHRWHGLGARAVGCSLVEVTAPHVSLSFSPAHLDALYAVYNAGYDAFPPTAAPSATPTPSAVATPPADALDASETVSSEGGTCDAAVPTDDGAPDLTGGEWRGKAAAGASSSTDTACPSAAADAAASVDDLREGGPFQLAAHCGARAAALTITHSASGAGECWVSWRYPLPRVVTSARLLDLSAISAISAAGPGGRTAGGAMQLDPSMPPRAHQEPRHQRSRSTDAALGAHAQRVTPNGGRHQRSNSGGNAGIDAPPPPPSASAPFVCELSSWDMLHERFEVVARGRMRGMGDACELLPCGAAAAGGAWEWRLAVRHQAVSDVSLTGGRTLLRRLLVDSADALHDLPPLLIRAELPGIQLHVSADGGKCGGAAEESGGAAPFADRAGGDALPSKLPSPTPLPSELFCLSLRSVRLRWASLGERRRGWRLRLRLRLACDVHDLDDLSLEPLVRENDLSLTVSSTAGRAATGERSLAFTVDGDSLEVRATPNRPPSPPSATFCHLLRPSASVTLHAPPFSHPTPVPYPTHPPVHPPALNLHRSMSAPRQSSWPPRSLRAASAPLSHLSQWPAARPAAPWMARRRRTTCRH